METKTLGAFLQKMRTVRGLTRRQLALCAALAPSTLGRWEEGKTLPRLPELEAALNALEASQQERLHAVSLLNAPRALVHLRREMQTRTHTELEVLRPDGGDLLRTLRRRAGKTLVETARCVGVSAAAISAWECGENWPQAEHLHSLCWHLGAQEKELAALLRGGLMLAQSPPEGAHQDILEQQIERFIAAPMAQGRMGLTDLEFLTLASSFWTTAMQHSTPRSLLARLYTAYGEFLYGQNRHRECLQVALHTEDLIAACGGSESAQWTERRIAIRAAQAGMETGGQRGVKQAEARLRRSLDSAQQPGDKVWLLCELGQAQIRRGCPDVAQDLAQQAARMLERCQETADYGASLHRVMVLFSNAGCPAEALEIASSQPTLLAVSPSYAHAMTKNFLQLGKKAEAQKWLQKAFGLLKSTPLAHAQYLPYYQTRIDALALAL